MKLTPNPAGVAALKAKADRAASGALDEVAAVARSTAPRRTGEYANNIRTAYVDGHGSLYSDLPQAMALERGANVGPRRGPHMGGQHVLEQAGDRWGEAFIRRAREG